MPPAAETATATNRPTTTATTAATTATAAEGHFRGRYAEADTQTEQLEQQRQQRQSAQQQQQRQQRRGAHRRGRCDGHGGVDGRQRIGVGGGGVGGVALPQFDAESQSHSQFVSQSAADGWRRWRRRALGAQRRRYDVIVRRGSSIH